AALHRSSPSSTYPGLRLQSSRLRRVDRNRCLQELLTALGWSVRHPGKSPQRCGVRSAPLVGRATPQNGRVSLPPVPFGPVNGGLHASMTACRCPLLAASVERCPGLKLSLSSGGAPLPQPTTINANANAETDV